MNLDAIRTASPPTPAPDVALRRPSVAWAAAADAPRRVAEPGLPRPHTPPEQDAAALPGAQDLTERLKIAAGQLDALNQSLSFRVHEGTGELMVQVVDRTNGKVLRETPPEEFLDLVVRLRDMVGLFLDETR